MTLVLAINGPETVWMVTDTRLSFKNGPPKDDGQKIMVLETTDGVALLGYAGLGKTARGTQPSTWMSSVLRGRNFPQERMLQMLADALKREFPPHLKGQSEIPLHIVIVSAFCEGKPQAYTIELVTTPDKSQFFRFVRRVHSERARPPRLSLAGSGATYLASKTDWIRTIFRTIKAHNNRKLSDYAVADVLAKINLEAHSHEKTVGPNCIVAWRHRNGGLHKGGGAHQFYEHGKRVNSDLLPIIGNGADIKAILQVLAPEFQRSLTAMMNGVSRDIDTGSLGEALSKLPVQPDEKLN